MKLKPFFSYFGSKYRAAKNYPAPVYNTIVEPFAGSAGYSVRYPHLNIVLRDISPVISGLWRYLITVSENDIRNLPIHVDHVDNLAVNQEAKWLIGFWLNQGTASPRKSPSAWARQGSAINFYWGEVIRERIAGQLQYIRHWEVSNASYENIPNTHATWFVDPPYQGKSGMNYPYRFSKYEELADWCKSRKGQTIVCEQEGATWLPFDNAFQSKILGTYNKRKSYSEVMWTNTNED